VQRTDRNTGTDRNLTGKAEIRSNNGTKRHKRISVISKHYR